MSAGLVAAGIITAGGIVGNFIAKYPKAKYDRAITEFENCHGQLETSYNRLCDLREQLKSGSFWDDEQSAEYLNSMDVEIKLVRNEMDTCQTTLQKLREIVGSYEDGAAVEEAVSGIANQIGSLGVNI